MFTMRFDMRSPHGGATDGAPTADLYQAALEMVAWAETRGAVLAIVCEHHGMADGYLPSPLVLATAMAARTTTLPVMVAVVVLPLYRPVRLAEEMVVLDIISRGRVSYVAAIGYRPEEYEMHGIDFHRRGAIAEEHLGVLLDAIPIEAAHVMGPDSGEEPGIFADFRRMLPDTPLQRLGRFQFYDMARGPDLALAISTGEERVYANVLLTIGVVMPK